MELREYWRVFKRRAWIPILLLIVTVATAGALTFLTKPTYTATATVEAKSTGNSTVAQTLSFQEVATSNSLALKVIQQLNLPDDVASFTKRVRVTAGHSDLYSVAITDRSPDQAASIANAVAQQAAILYMQLNAATGSTVFDQNIQSARTDFQKRFAAAETALLTFQRQHPSADESGDISLITQHKQLQLDEQAAAAAYQAFEQQTTSDTVNQLSQANNFFATVVDQAAAKPDTLSRYLKVAYAGALALLLGIGLIYLLEYMDTSVREPEGVEELVGAPVVGIIPKATPQTLRPARGGAA